MRFFFFAAVILAVVCCSFVHVQAQSIQDEATLNSKNCAIDTDCMKYNPAAKCSSHAHHAGNAWVCYTENSVQAGAPCFMSKQCIGSGANHQSYCDRSNATGATCQSTKTNGTSCSTHHECQSNFCSKDNEQDATGTCQTNVKLAAASQGFMSSMLHATQGLSTGVSVVIVLSVGLVIAVIAALIYRSCKRQTAAPSDANGHISGPHGVTYAPQSLAYVPPTAPTEDDCEMQGYHSVDPESEPASKTYPKL